MSGRWAMNFKALLNPSRGQSACISLRFDDGRRDAIANGLPILERYGLTASMYVIASGASTFEERRDLGFDLAGPKDLARWRSGGNPVGSHSLTHVDLTRQSLPEQRIQLEESKRILEDYGLGPITVFAPPGSRWNGQLAQLALRYYTAVTLDGTAHHYGPRHIAAFAPRRVHLLAHILVLVALAWLTRSWLVLSFHSISGNTYDQYSWPIERFRRLCWCLAVLKRRLPVRTIEDVVEETHQDRTLANNVESKT